MFLTLVLLLNVGASSLLAQDAPPAAEERLAAAQTLLNSMSPAERVGQLFLVTFQGDRATLESDIADLITNYHVGGVVLSTENDNITGYGDPDNITGQTSELIRSLQSLALRGLPLPEIDATDVEEGSVPPTPEPPDPFTPIPLFIAVAHEGDGYPNSTILNGLTDVPSNMAIGATWRPALAQQVGKVVGEELAKLGINMLFGPSLDVVENPDPFSASDLGVRSFGGDPYWVGVMGSAYTAGVHLGSNNRIAVIPKHFPGFGASDRPLHEEVPTVRKSLEQLRQIELAPFFAVTGAATRPEAIADGLLTTHIRYQGFQGNIRATTNPVSLDPLALAALMAQQELSSWRTAGGLIVSDKLGVRAVERFYGQDQGFPHRVVAKDAFLAGNDLLYLSDFALSDAPYEAQLANIIDTILWFQDRYQTDVAFQQQVDTAVLRILQLKLKLHNDSFDANALLATDPFTEVEIRSGEGAATVIDVAQSSLTLIAPDPEELVERLVQPPTAGENILIFTDMRTFQQCSFCEPEPLIGLNAVEERMLALYGPQASAQLQPEQISSYRFADLQSFIDAGPGAIIYDTSPITPTVIPGSTPTPEDGPTPLPAPTATPPPAFLVQEDLAEADWIIFAMLDRSGANSLALNNFLARRPDLVRQRRVVVFAFNAPYYLDSTEITQLAALFGLYSHNEAAIDTAVRALFQELPFNGASPVNIAGASYDLFLQTQPTASQVIGLDVTNLNSEADASAGDEPFDVKVGDTLRLQTGVILDNNGNAVPDGTVVRFRQRDRVAGTENILGEVPTTNGVAQLDYVLEARTEGGQFRIVAESGAAMISQEVDIRVGTTESGGGAQVSIIDPTPQPTPTAEPSPTATVTATTPPTDAPEPTSTAAQPPLQPQEPGIRIELSEFGLLTAVFAGLLVSSGAAFSLGRQQNVGLEQQIGWPLWTIVAGLMSYIYFKLGLPGASALGEIQMGWGFLTSFAGGLVGLIAYWLRQRFR
ncbi:MAG: hypothetical protein H6654_18455 [Ardenticatenaceae bacterium]|nr:hypothetical protein [Anaerolineales bacterium]MCB8937472.1 hypothetical protein [Ardenticatenaceae bacterium]MCB8975547.1 hypothetical protein [Ardenticatenaceae bacterium]